MSSASEFTPIAIDAMGSDLGPSEVVEAVSLALNEIQEPIRLILVGQESVLTPLLTAKSLHQDDRVSIHHAPEVVGMDEKPKDSYRNKKDSSMLQAIELVKNGKARAVISCGNTGTLMFSGTLMLRKLPGVERPALATIIPSDNHRFLMVDVGAQPDTTASQLVQNAILGSQYCAGVLSYERPRVGLLTIGTEEGKGTEKVTEAHEYLKKLDGVIHYIGLIEGFDTFKNVADVVVCDGFTGNIVLKSLESCYSTLKDFLKKELMASAVRKIGAGLSKGAFTAMKDQLNPAKYSGAPLLGLQGIVLKTHGSSDREFIKGAISVGLKALENYEPQQIEKDIEKANAIMKAAANSNPETEAVNP